MSADPSTLLEPGVAPEKVLIICLGAIGDVTRALPLAVRIKEHWPETALHWAVEPISRSILENHPAIDEIHLFDRPKGFSAYRDFVSRLSRQRFDLVLDLQRHFKSGVSSFLTRAPRRLAFHRKNSREFNWLLNTEEVEESPHFSSKVMQFQKFGDSLGLPAQEEPLDFGLRSTPDELLEIQTLLKVESQEQNVQLVPSDRRVGLLLGSTWESRFWLVERYVELIESLYARWGIQSYLIGSRGERAFAEQVQQGVVNAPLVSLIEKTSLRQLVALFEELAIVIGSDCGPMHIAAAVGKPVISLWGSTSPRRSAPHGSEDYVVQAGVTCSPCYKKQCPGLGTICMKAISSAAVEAQVERILSPSQGQ